MSKPKIVIAGASGFVGRWLIEQLVPDFEVIALSRSPIENSHPNVNWRVADLFSVTSTYEALKDADYAIYLVHSMLPSTRLSQGTFEDNDLIIADNFAIAASAHGIKQIIYLSGIIPEVRELSEHLRSRHEVEEVLASKGTPVTTFRAGMVVGPNGSSFRIMENLLKRLPVLVLPAWTKSPSQAVSLDQVLLSIRNAIGKSEWFNKSIDLGCGETLTYEQMLRRCARYLKLKRVFIPVPIRSTGFSKLWVSLVSGTPIELTSPLIDSLKYPIIPKLESMKQLGTYKKEVFEDLLAHAHCDKQLPRLKRKGESVVENNVRSIQRLPSFPENTSAWLAQEYLQWLPQFFRYIIKVRVSGEKAEFHCLGIKLLELTHVSERSNTDRHLFFITGGILCKRVDHGWLEFRQVNQKKWTLTGIHEFVPTLPWWLYRLTQAPLHSYVMKQFGKHLSKLSLSGKLL